MTITASHSLARRLLAVLGTTLLVPACVDDRVELETLAGTDSGTTASGPSTTSDSASSVGSSAPQEEGEVGGGDCGPPVSRVVCVPPPGSEGSTGLGSTGADEGTDGGTTATAGSDDGSSEGSTDGATTSGTAGSEGTGAGPVSCEGANPQDYSFCVYEEGELFEQDGQCCRLLEGYGECCDGRPFIVGDELRTAPAVCSADWQGRERPAIEGLSATERVALAAAWQADGLMEHASIASFARFVLHLLALGAPPSLVGAAQQALADEVEHARRCFALAGAYAGHPVGPGPLAIDGALAGPLTLREAAVAAVLEGCIGETLAAHQAAAAAEVATDPVVRRVLAGIAEDEARHAELAWRFVAWALARGGAEVREAVVRAFVGAQPVGRAEDAREAPIDAATWHAHGRLAPRELARTLERGYRDVIAPCARALLVGSSGSPGRGDATRERAVAAA